MNPRYRHILLLSGAMVACVGVALLAGCKGNTSAAANVERRVGAPPVVDALPVGGGGDARRGDPLSNPVWTNASWMPLAAPANTDRTTAPVSAAILYDPTYLYVAFICNRSNPAFRLANRTAPIAQDMVSIYLDSSKAANGAEMLQVTVNETGLTTCAWMRDAEPPVQARPDGTPDVYHPVSRITDVSVAGLFSKIGQGVRSGEEAWTAVVGIPLKSLPLPLRAVPAAGAVWKVNLLRTTVLADVGAGARQLQANLSPVYVAQQAVSPYRMAELRLTAGQVSLVLPTRP